MNLRNSFWTRRVDNFLLLLVIFSILLFSMFAYLEKIDKDIRNYGIYQTKLQNMIIYEKDMENCFLKTFRYVDYDYIDNIMKKFENDIVFLKNSGIKNEFGEDSYRMVLDIEKSYEQKMDLVEQFQSANTRATNAIHYLYDLRKTIKEKFPQNKEKNKLMDQFFFLFGKVLMGMPLDTLLLNKDLEELKQQSDNVYLKYFYIQTNQFMEDVKLIKSLMESNSKIDTQGVIESLVGDLSQKYGRNLYQQKIIALSFFILAFIVLIILFVHYRRMKRASTELKAFRYAVENSDNSVVITDADRHILYANESFEVNSGYKIDEVLGENPNILKSGLLEDSFYKELNETLDQGKKWQGVLINKRKNGTLLYEKASIMPIIVNGNLEQYLAIKLDVTEFIEQQKRLQQASIAFQNVGEGIMITDSEKRIISINPAFEKIFGYEFQDLAGMEPSIVIDADGQGLSYQKIWAITDAKGQWSGRIKNRAKSGKLIPIWLNVTLVKSDDGKPQNYIAIFTDLEKVIEMEEKVDFLAYHDALTKLPNRAYVEKELADIFAIAKTFDKRVAVLFVDLDRFKVINDTLGHDVGDKMLVVLSERLGQAVGGKNLLARFGGDEFIVVMNDVVSKKEVIDQAESMLRVIRKPISVYDYHLNTTASIGVAMFPEDGEEIGIVLKHADAAMYHAKEKGKDNYRFYTSQLSIDMHTRLELEQKLQHAIENDEMYLVYQPQYDLKSGKVCGAEALLRWNSAEMGVISPSQFIPIAEETGAIVKIGYFVLEEAAREYVRWMKEGLDIDWVAVNISSMQFRQDDLLENIKSIIEKVDISPESLELEITERCMMEYTNENMKILEELQNMGCRISIDDFGTGYSSMDSLKNFDMDNIKIDKSFIDDIPGSQSNKEVSAAIIALSHTLGFKVVAEGIEYKEQEEFLIEHDCDYGQGYYFSKPLDKDVFVSFVKNITPK